MFGLVKAEWGLKVKWTMEATRYTNFVEEYRRLAEAVGMGALRGKWMLYGLMGGGGMLWRLKLTSGLYRY